MRRRISPLLALALAAVAGAAGAEAPLEAVRPAVRPVLEPPGRPEARPAEQASAEMVVGPPAPGQPVIRSGDGTVAPMTPLEITLRPDGSPLVPVLAPELPLPPPMVPLPELVRDHLPAVPRQPPLVGTEPPPPPLEGLPGTVRAEEMFQGPPPVLVVVAGWTGESPPLRPGVEPARDPGPQPMRPRARPLSPSDPTPLLPPEPDALPAYAPAARPDILPVGPEYSPLAVARAILPFERPEGVVERAEAARQAAIRGQVCGNPLIQGEVAAPIRAGGGCGIEEPVRVRSVDGVRLSSPALMDCTTAEALLEWVQDGARPAVGGQGGGLAELDVMGDYSCRPRNNQAGGRLSEHGKGHAIDIGGVTLADGSVINVLRDWPDPVLRGMHASACGIFSTVLGPGSDRFHSNHLHLDTARGRGAYCR